MANVWLGRLAKWCSLLPIGIAACIGSIHLTNVSKPIATLNALELEEIPEIQEEEIEPEQKPPEQKDDQSQQQQQQQNQQQENQDQVAAAQTDNSSGEDDKSADTTTSSDTDPQSATTDMSSQDSAAVQGGAVATGADTPIEVIRRGLIGISRMNTSEGRMKDLGQISGLINTLNQLNAAAKQVQHSQTGSIASPTPNAPQGQVASQGTPSPQA